ncbi:MAG: N-acetylmuramoyl-L-alanine amidase [Acetobacteraceae bacterium]|nr:N-acetylmuramoyl-L-alanine amidase [Acetobacteraceae bacterium]
MSCTAPVTRRLLLGRLGTGAGVVGTFLLPASLHAAMAARASHQPSSPQHPSSPVPPKSGARPPAPLVMLDPGHGGKDPGAIGVSGTYEKHVSLAAALELKHLLEAGGRYRVELTRARDVFIPLDDRVARAQAHSAALFVSMHADALSDHSVRGASVYTLANTASDAQTAALAQRENSADRFIGRSWHTGSPAVEHILASLVRQETRVGSARMANKLVGSLDQDLPMLPNPERHAGFQVLKAADIPSVLVEMGFMSNARDEAALRRPDHRRMVALAMQRAVDAWFAATGHVAGADPGGDPWEATPSGARSAKTTSG